MHEHFICKTIIEKALEYNNVKSITVEVGELATPPVEDIKQYLTTRTMWKVVMRSRKAIINCDCGFSGNPLILEKNHANVVYKCPDCKTLLPEVVEGDKIILKNVEVK